MRCGNGHRSNLGVPSVCLVYTNALTSESILPSRNADRTLHSGELTHHLFWRYRPPMQVYFVSR